MNLKTLKDIQQINGFGIPFVNLNELKEAAKEWIKENQKIIDGFDIYLYNELVKKREYAAVNKWIEYFFNLNEDETKSDSLASEDWEVDVPDDDEEEAKDYHFRK